MRFRLEHPLPGEPSAVFAILRSPDFQIAMDARVGLEKTPLPVDGEGGGAERLRWWVLERGHRPAFVTRILGPAIAYTLEHRVDPAAFRIDWEVTPAVGAERVVARGFERLEPASGATRRIVEGEVEVGLPVVGRRLADYIGGEVEAGFRDAVPFIESWVRARRSG